jgi:hypothetical protein
MPANPGTLSDRMILKPAHLLALAALLAAFAWAAVRVGNAAPAPARDYAVMSAAGMDAQARATLAGIYGPADGLQIRWSLPSWPATPAPAVCGELRWQGAPGWRRFVAILDHRKLVHVDGETTAPDNFARVWAQSCGFGKPV